ncbi:DUF3533 domain-containing protein [Rhodococcus triatomae]|uniref:YhgE/Pip N-terminal domain-containing protein n=1 Tax=Rhodococcus triatomae TaxID=300028 RepID=A0A1G8RQ50_9NOCA|nr:DUF3533 domain-containing protein [Rhodococcus triatomae]QNG19880.1 DUF3533 domain-containing protein [Rhodococcus triatomae]QNG24204.1 DUF3533 domain-containing protein [Rhodococcus triatomae]SDJ19098.1 YhgE/Pip N-terminal domain-containing protein [Rhodococcus triatomae]
MAIDRSVLRHPRLWGAPVALVAVLMSLLGALYLSSTLDPQQHLHDFPIALVVRDDGEPLDGGYENVGERIAQGLEDNVPSEQFRLERMGIARARGELASGDLYGAIVVPVDFTKRLSILGQGSVIPGEMEKPVITVYSNPRLGIGGAEVMDRFTAEALGQVVETVGAELTARVDAELADGAASVPGAARIALAEPVQVLEVDFAPLPDGIGNGLAVFFFALAIVLAGFTGSMIVHSIVDGHLGYTPTEYGPFYVHEPHAGLSRLQTLLIKWALVVVIAGVVAALYLWIATAMGMPVPSPGQLWLFSALSIAAVGILATSILVVFGTPGLLVNLVLFIILGLPSSGATVPLEASPQFFSVLAPLEPMYQVHRGVQAILFFGGGERVTGAVVALLVVLALGLVLGVVAAAVYDRRGWHRVPREAEPPTDPAAPDLPHRSGSVRTRVPS